MITWNGVGAKVMAFKTFGCLAAVTMAIKPPMECPVSVRLCFGRSF